MQKLVIIFFLLIPALALSAEADEMEADTGDDYIPLTADTQFLHVVHEGKSVKVQRVQELRNGDFSKAVRKPKNGIFPLPRNWCCGVTVRRAANRLGRLKAC